MKLTYPWRRTLPALALLATFSLIDLASAGASTYAVRNGTVSSAGSIAAADCYSMVSTLGEPVAGTTAAGRYRITSGFPATLVDTQIATGTFVVFKDGFEGNSTQGCTP